MTCGMISCILVASQTKREGKTCNCQPVELGKEFAETIALQMGDTGVLPLRSQLLNDLLGAVLVHGSRITAQELFLF